MSLSVMSPVRLRNLRMLSQPDRWPHWPFLPVIRRLPGKAAELGVVFDAMGTANLPGFSATVFLTNLLMMPRQLDEFLVLPKEVFDTREELIDAGWYVD